jgi:hypothetical protein
VPFTQLIQNAMAFIDVRKQLVTTVPGLFLAVALVVLTGTAPAWVARPFACAGVTPLKRQAAADAETLRVWDSKRSAADRTNEDLIRLRAEEATLRRQLQRAVVTVQNCDAKTCPQALSELSAASEAVKKFVLDSKSYRVTTPITSSAADNSAAEADRAQLDLFEAHRKLAWLEVDPTCSATPAGWDVIAADVLMFGLLGFLLGLMRDPLNKALFLQMLPDAADAEPSRDAKLHRVRRALAAAFVPSRQIRREDDPLTERRAQFYIGRGLITEAEYHALVDNYYRFAELTIGLVIPMLVTAVALFQYQWVRGRQWWALSAVAVVVFATALARIGVRRHAEFREATTDFIAGRLEKLKDEERKRSKTVNLLQLTRLVARAEALRERSST